MSGVQQNMGVHTCAVGMTLTAAQYYEIKDGLGDFLRKSDGNYWSCLLYTSGFHMANFCATVPPSR